MGNINDAEKQKTVMARALRQIKTLSAEVEALKEPIAVVGLGCRFPGADDITQFWDLLRSGVDMTTDMPETRFDLSRDYHPDPDVKGKMSVCRGSFFSAIDQFDPYFFGISPREAQSMDPQQRLLLEVCWEALENTGLLHERNLPSATGVFVGVSTGDYASPSLMLNDYKQIDAYSLTGNAANATVGRLSYVFGFIGPNIAVDTACSSSLVAIHQACQSLRSGECEQAIAGGINLIISPANTIALSQNKVLSPDGRCKTFDASADGMARGEGCGLIVLKRLSSALQDGNPIWGIIRGSAINQDGPTSGFTVPNGRSQQSLLQTALEKAQVEPDEIDYIEAHGTGTPLGDPIEISAIQAVFGQTRQNVQPLKVGSVKTNIAHTEAAAGVAGIIKVLLSMHHENIPAHLHFHQPNPEIAWDSRVIDVAVKQTVWQRGSRKRLAGVSSFGFSGVNAHVILEEAPLSSLCIKPTHDIKPDGGQNHVLCLSAKTSDSLHHQIRRYISYLRDQPEMSLADICYSLNTGRLHFENRLSVVGHSVNEIVSQLQHIVENFSPDKFRTANVPELVMFFPETGHYRPDVVKRMYHDYAVFRQCIDYCSKLLIPHLNYPLYDILWSETATGDFVGTLLHGQVIGFVLGYATATLWESWGIPIHTVTGVGSGAYAAACVAGILMPEDIIALIIAQDKGRKAFTQAVEQAVYHMPSRDYLSLASGENIAQHMASATGWLEQFDMASDMDQRSLQIRLESSGYDACLIVSTPPFSFSSAMTCVSAFPDMQDDHARCVLLSSLYQAGVMLRWNDIYPSEGYHRLHWLPTYAFQRQTYWKNLPKLPVRGDGEVHPLLGRKVLLPPVSSFICLFENWLSVQSVTYLADHSLDGRVIVPAAALLEMGMIAGKAGLNQDSIELENIEFQQPLYLADGGCLVQTTLSESEDDCCYTFGIYSRNDAADEQSWLCHVQGKVVLVSEKDTPSNHVLSSLQDACQQVLDVDVYNITSGVCLGESFQCQRQLWGGLEQVLARIELPVSVEMSRGDVLHPVLLDGAFQLLAAFLDKNERDKSVYLPVGVKRFRVLSHPTATLWGHARLIRARQNSIELDLCLFSESGEIVACIDGFQVVSRNPSHTAAQIQHLLYREDWQHIELSTDVSPNLPEPGNTWLIFADQDGQGAAMAVDLEDLQQRVLLVYKERLPEKRGDNNTPAVVYTDADALEALCQEYLGGVPKQVGYLWGLDISANEEDVADKVFHTCRLWMETVQALSRFDFVLPPRIWLITRQVQELCHEESASLTCQNLAQAPLWNLGQVMACEFSQWRFRFVDIDSVSVMSGRESPFLHTLLAQDEEAHLMLRGEQTYARRIAPYQPEWGDGHTSASIDPEGLYVVTGGLGGLGFAVTEWLVSQGAKHLLLLGRNRAGTEKEKRISELSHQGIDIQVECADVSHYQDMDRIFSEHGSRYPIKGVIHTAGVLDDGMIKNYLPERLSGVLAPKVAGAWNLHRLTQSLPLDLFVLFSSASSYLPGNGQGAYAAANGFLDTLASYRRMHHLPAQSINWGPWQDVGMASALNTAEQERLKSIGMKFISVRQGCEIMQALIHGQLKGVPSQVMALDIHWPHYASHCKFPALLKALPAMRVQRLEKEEQSHPLKNSSTLSKFQTRTTTSPLLSVLEQTPADNRHRVLATHLVDMVAQVMGIEQVEMIDIDKQLFDIGMDSLMAVEFKNMLQNQLAYSFHSTLIFDFPTIKRLAGYIVDECLSFDLSDVTDIDEVTEEESQIDTESVSTLGMLESMTDEEVAELMMSQFES
ncbi:type I polyketide synthase [Vibrio sp. MEBiC08052]|uniref:type I polyketide synthase n=1 Tax=Vibrio sp. MEBiC08052 TaxID=1761910 RepID=UPI0007406BE6|nr:type I polyketide synthase [Vibrio sp. MEBiC08052]KUI98277.1 hypothetical protein VRK_29780 [Vibrio sp. MEBiC08052]